MRRQGRLKPALLRAIQTRCARVAVGPSTVRGAGSGKVAEKARAFLSTLPLRPFGSAQPARFRAQLDRATRRLAAALPPTQHKWGLARKVLNIFLRDALYTVYLRDTFRLDRAEFLFELPLDTITAKALRKKAGRHALPRWPGVRALESGESERYQEAALAIAELQDIARVHLDAFLWAGRDE